MTSIFSKGLVTDTCRILRLVTQVDLNEKIRGETLQEILKNNNEEAIAKVMKEIIRKDNEKKENETYKEQDQHCSPPKRVEPPRWVSVTDINIYG